MINLGQGIMFLGSQKLGHLTGHQWTVGVAGGRTRVAEIISPADYLSSNGGVDYVLVGAVYGYQDQFLHAIVEPEIKPNGICAGFQQHVIDLCHIDFESSNGVHIGIAPVGGPGNGGLERNEIRTFCHGVED
jgi:hypothetical protein